MAENKFYGFPQDQAPQPLNTEQPQQTGGNVKVTMPQKKSAFGTILESFISTDAKDISGTVYKNVVVPGIQRIIIDAVSNSIYWLFNGIKGNYNKSNGGGFYTANNSSFGYTFSNPGYTNYSKVETIPANLTQGKKYPFANLGMKNPDTANNVLYMMREALVKYGKVRVADYYSFVEQLSQEKLGMQPTYTDNDWGWTNLENVYAAIGKDGWWYIQLPQAVSLK